MYDYDEWILSWKKWLAYWIVAINYYWGWWVLVGFGLISLAFILTFICDWSVF